ncbi:hypothetical protein P5673_030525 [Acropora cervicornis]|uniref:Uncharacterized protein n=1 Tax=Acropora cervicornis TaxID=6130 RepID=A0AAD9PU47_ACRCE|nr:hypothetical protein P5673_030525 [Acropora cervicornis]
MPAADIANASDEWRLYIHDEEIMKPEKGPRVDHYWRDIFQLQTANGNPRYPLLTRIVKAALDMVKFSDPQSHRLERVPVTKKLLSSVRSTHAAYRQKCEKEKEEAEIAR